MSYPFLYFENHAGGYFTDPRGEKFPFIADPTGANKQRAKAAMDAANRDYKPLTSAERAAIRQSEKQAAIDIRTAERRAAANAPKGPVPPVTRERIRELERSRFPEERARAIRFKGILRDWEEAQAAQQAAAETQEAIDAEPENRTAREYAAGLVKLAKTQDQREKAAYIKGLADAGQGRRAWEHIREYETEQWDAEDRAAADALAARTVAEGEFNRTAASAEDARARAEHAAKQAGAAE